MGDLFLSPLVAKTENSTDLDGIRQLQFDEKVLKGQNRSFLSDAEALTFDFDVWSIYQKP